MNTIFYLELNVKTTTGFERYGCFDLGEDRGLALTLFSRLEGQPPEGDAGVLHLDLVEKYRGLPVNIRVVSCTMDQLCRNVKIITRETFRRLNLGDLQT
ncbi:MAG TPA: hypothetical protein VHW43_06895 [Puia sp.]|nr:hypothetical protein [Puia sp.]